MIASGIWSALTPRRGLIGNEDPIGQLTPSLNNGPGSKSGILRMDRLPDAMLLASSKHNMRTLQLRLEITWSTPRPWLRTMLRWDSRSSISLHCHTRVI
jgi:hypothetical protein